MGCFRYKFVEAIMVKVAKKSWDSFFFNDL